jgi:hypothetical protein
MISTAKTTRILAVSRVVHGNAFPVEVKSSKSSCPVLRLTGQVDYPYVLLSLLSLPPETHGLGSKRP